MDTILRTLLTLCLLHTAFTHQIVRLGHEIKASFRGPELPGLTFLADDYSLTGGRLFAFSAFMRNANPAVLQIWRQVESNDPNDYPYKLIREISLIPTVINGREDIYFIFEYGTCPLTRAGDRIGVYTAVGPSPIAYTFTDTAVSIQHQADPDNRYNVSDTVFFDTLAFPFALSLAAYIDTNMTGIDYDNDTMELPCPNVRIPDDRFPTLNVSTTTTPLPTGAPGQKGDQGAQGPKGERGPTGPEGPAGMNGTDGAEGAMGVQGPKGDQGLMGPTGPAGIQGSVGEKGEQGDAGVRGPTGPAGVDGADGADGMDGRDGMPGVNATWKIYSDGVDPAAAVDEEEDMWMNSLLIMILVIWLIVVTVVLFILSIAFCCFACKKDEKPAYARQPSVQPAGNGTYVNVGYAGNDEFSTDPEKKNVNRMSSFEPGKGWVGTMKADDTMEYENMTIEREASKKNKPAPLTELPPHIYEGDGSGKKIPKTPDSTLEDPKDAADVAVEVPETPNYPPPQPLDGATVNGSPDGMSPTTPNNRWSQSQDQMIAY